MIGRKIEIKIKPEKNEVIEAQKLPTTLDIAQFTTPEYKTLLPHLSEELRTTFLESQRIKNCFAGTSPEIGAQAESFLDDLSAQELAELKEKLAKYAPDIVVITHPDKRHGKDILSLINLRAASHIIQSNPTLFPPEALSNPRTWIKDSPQQWWQTGSKIDDHTVMRYGLLSGYPKYACEAYPRYYDLRRKLQLNLASAEEIQFINTSDQLEQKTPDEIARLMEIFAKIGPEDHQLLASRHSVTSKKLGIGYVGFDQTFDANYIRQLESIYDDSKIEAEDNTLQKRIKILPLRIRVRGNSP